MEPTRKELVDEIISVVHSIADILRQQTLTTIPVKNAQWTIGTAAAHLVISQKLSKNILQGEKNPYKDAKPEVVTQTNKQLLSEFTERRGDKLATMLIMNTEAFLKSVQNYNDSYVVKTHWGRMDLLTGLSYNLCHLLIHGNQIALSLQEQLPLEEKHIPLALPFLKRAISVAYDRKAAQNFVGTFAIHLRDVSDFAIICEGEKITVTEKIPKRVDCHISADPKAYFLVSCGIIKQWKSLLQGKFFIWGRKPWLAFKLVTLFKSP